MSATASSAAITVITTRPENYKYRHPVTRVERGMGSDKRAANAAARQLNSILMRGQDLVANVLGDNKQTMSTVIKRYEDEHVPTKKLKPSTLKILGYRTNKLHSDLGDKLITSLTVENIADYLDLNFKRNAYTKHRNLLADIFKFAMTKGLYTNKENPVLATYAKSNVEKERQRLNLKQFQAIHQVAPQWLKNAMELSLVTLQGRSEICNAKFSDIENGILRVVREKTKEKSERAYLEIEITSEIECILSRCRQSGIDSPYIIHRKPVRRCKSELRDHWTQVLPEILTNEFKKAGLKSGIFNNIPEKNRPTFHEIRALGSHLYEKYGYGTEEYVQPLMAHSDKEMTEYYQSGHEIRWTRVHAELPLSDIMAEGNAKIVPK